MLLFIWKLQFGVLDSRESGRYNLIETSPKGKEDYAVTFLVFEDKVYLWFLEPFNCIDVYDSEYLHVAE